MKTLPTHFRKDGFDYHLVKRNGLVAIYEQSKTVGKLTFKVGYEVGRIRQNKARTTFGKDFEASESWPSSEEWGVRAWTYPNLADTEVRYGSLHGPNA